MNWQEPKHHADDLCVSFYLRSEQSGQQTPPADRALEAVACWRVGGARPRRRALPQSLMSPLGREQSFGSY